MSQLTISERAASREGEPARPFLTDPEIIARVLDVEARLRSLVSGGLAQRFVGVDQVRQAADDLRRLADDLRPSEVGK